MSAYAKISNVLFLDVETVPCYDDYEKLEQRFKDLWVTKSRKYSNYEEGTPEELYFRKAGIHAEFAKIVTISVGFVKEKPDGGGLFFRGKTFYSHNEKEILTAFAELLNSSYNQPDKHILCAHNGIEFDFPFIARRMMINDIALPRLLDVAGSKSWNNKWLVDTMDLWRFGDIKEKTSLELMAACFNIPTPKNDISGKDVAHVYYQENDLERIARYCMNDVVTMAKLYLKFRGLPAFKDEDVQV